MLEKQKLINRVRMRRAYNSGNWEKSRFYANKLLTYTNETNLAKSVIVRSYWNEGDLERVGEMLAIWREKGLDFMREKYQDATSVPPMKNNPSEPGKKVEWNPDEIISNFVQEGDLLWMKTPNMWVYWEMPSNFELENTSPALLELAAELLLRPWVKSTKQKVKSYIVLHMMSDFMSSRDNISYKIIIHNITCNKKESSSCIITFQYRQNLKMIVE